MKKGKSFWNSIAKNYVKGDTFSRQYALNPSLFKLLADVKDKKILDVGCGTGKVSLYLAKKHAYVTGIDFSNKMINYAREEAKRSNLKIELKVLDVKELEKLKGKYDIVLISLLLPHLKTKIELLNLFKNVNKLLETNGRLIIAEPHPLFDSYMRENLTSGKFNYFNSGLPHKFTIRHKENKFESEAYHWMLEDYVDILIKAGFLINRLLEPKLEKMAQKIDLKYFQQKYKFPSYIILSCIKDKF